MEAPRVLRAEGGIGGEREKVNVVFFSGGKDSFVALRRAQRGVLTPGMASIPTGELPIVLLTVFNQDNGLVGQEEVPLAWIAGIARALRLDLIAVPQGPGADHVEALKLGLSHAETSHGLCAAGLVFGDADAASGMRAWRETHVAGALGVPAFFPAWEEPRDALMEDLTSEGLSVLLSSVDVTLLPTHALNVAFPGAAFDAAFVQTLSDLSLPAHNVHPFGDRGEFHTLVLPNLLDSALRSEILSCLNRRRGDLASAATDARQPPDALL
mmetsp:Transcript_25320/g.74348  ORF Transcript_25320/g.74348 Transcript_25320/m.74348 type:complete len:269 (-) Transcript_25320:188-994(-)